MVRATIRPTGIALVCALLAAGAAASDAHAWENHYCGVQLNSGSWCGDGSNHSYDYNRATYNGSSNVFVCARLLYADSTVVRDSYCAYNFASQSVYNNCCYLYEAEVKHSSSGNRFTIHGYAWA